MGAFLASNIIEIIFGTISVVTTLIALHYQRLANQRDTEKVISAHNKVKLFLSRQAMMAYLLAMYDRAEAGDVIWAQCVRCTDFSHDVHSKILQAAGNGVRYQMAVNQESPAAEEFMTLFSPLQHADLRLSANNDLSLQGLSDEEVVITLPGNQGYTAVLVRHKPFVRLMRDWFTKRFQQMPSAKTAIQPA